MAQKAVNHLKTSSSSRCKLVFWERIKERGFTTCQLWSVSFPFNHLHAYTRLLMNFPRNCHSATDIPCCIEAQAYVSVAELVQAFQVSLVVKGQVNSYFSTGGKIISHVWEKKFPRVGKMIGLRNISLDFTELTFFIAVWE